MQAVRHDRTAQQTNLCFQCYFMLTFHTVTHATGCHGLVNIFLQNKYAVLFLQKSFSSQIIITEGSSAAHKHKKTDKWYSINIHELAGRAGPLAGC